MVGGANLRVKVDRVSRRIRCQKEIKNIGDVSMAVKYGAAPAARSLVRAKV